MTKQQLLRILKRIDHWKRHADAQQEAMDMFVKVLAPNSYSPIIEHNGLDGFIDGVSFNNEDMKEPLEYYAFELPGMDEASGTDKNGKEYDLKNKDEFVEFILNS